MIPTMITNTASIKVHSESELLRNRGHVIRYLLMSLLI